MGVRVIVGLRLDAHSRETLNAARSISEELGAPLVAVHAIPPDAGTFIESTTQPDTSSEWWKQAESAGLEGLKALIGDDPSVDLQVLHGWPEENILRLATPEDTVVVGRNPTTPLIRLGVSPLASKLAKSCPSRLVVVPA